jgi:hypothetical protein
MPKRSSSQVDDQICALTAQEKNFWWCCVAGSAGNRICGTWVRGNRAETNIRITEIRIWRGRLGGGALTDKPDLNAGEPNIRKYWAVLRDLFLTKRWSRRFRWLETKHVSCLECFIFSKGRAAIGLPRGQILCLSEARRRSLTSKADRCRRSKTRCCDSERSPRQRSVSVSGFGSE